MPRFPVAEWQAEHCRLTIFPIPSNPTNVASEWWEAIARDQPDEAKFNPKTGSGTLTGAFGDAKLTLKLEPGRIDWLLGPRDPDPDSVPEEPFFVVGSAPDTLERFSALAHQFLSREDVPAVTRMALGAVFLHPEVDRRTGYERLPNYVPVRIDPGSSDFLYQINLPRVPSGSVDGLQLNRLSKWSVIARKILAFRFTGASLDSQPLPEAFAMRVEVDVNTAPDFAGPIPPDRLWNVYEELVGAGREIATNGLVTE